MPSPTPIKRITLFKSINDNATADILAQYETLRKTAQKDGKPYIISSEASKIINQQEGRSQGYTVLVQTVFSSMTDVQYYDEECEAHQKLKGVVKPLVSGVAVLLSEYQGET